MRKTGFIIAALAAAAIAGTTAYADDLTFRTAEGTVSYAEEVGTAVGISKEDLIRFGKEERNEERAYEMKGVAKVDVGLEVGDDESGMTMKVKADVNALYQKDASDGEHSLLDMSASMFGQNVKKTQESYAWKDAFGHDASYVRESDDEGVMGDWRIGEASASAGVVDDALEQVIGEFDLLENMYTDEKGYGYYVLQAEKTFDELAAMAGEVSEDAESATEGFEFDRPVKITLMYRVDDCAFARGYADVENMTGTADGDLFGSETPVKMTVDGIITLSVDDMEGKVVIPDELPTENPMEQTEAAVPAAEGGVAMTIDGKEIAVPSRARAIAESGWTIEKEYSGDEQVEPDSLTYVKFAKDDMDLTAFVYNVGDETADALDCEIYELSFMKGYGDAANDAQILGGLVKIGMSEAEVAAALDGAGIKYEKEDQQNGYCYYEIPMGGDSVGYEIGLNEDEGVWQIQARNETVWN